MGENGKFVMMDGTLVWVPDFSKQSINNDAAIDFIIKEEGFLKKPKDIGDGKITIGSGLTDPKWIELYKARGNKWSDEDNRMAVAEEVQKRREWNEENVPNWERFSPSAQNALLSYRYNYNYTRDNSPKLFKALEDFNLFEAAQQMDATSGNNKFTKGLGDRREREQNLFLSDYNQEPSIFNTEPEVPVSTKVTIPYPTKLENTKRVPAGPYKDEYVVTESEKRRQQLRKAFKAKQDYDRIMEATNLPNTATPLFTSTSSLFAKGGWLEPKDAWDKLTIPEKADIIKVGVKHGIFDLQELRKKYNEFKKGGSKEEEEEVNTEKDYINTMERVAEENYRKWGYDNSDEALLHALNDNTYNYRGYYEKYPQSAANADTHWSDKFKTVYHPTFSRESIYSGLKSQYNPDGLVGGHWIKDTFIPAPWQIEHKHSIGGPLVDVANYRDENIYGLGDWLKKGLNWLKNSAQVAAIAESPSVMTAAGHRVTREGKAVQDRQNSKDVKQLRQNLANFGEGALGALTATGDVETAYNVVRHPVQTAKVIKSGITNTRKAIGKGLTDLITKGKSPLKEQDLGLSIGKANETQKYAELGRKDFLEDIASDWYRKRWENATSLSAEDLDRVIGEIKTSAENVPFDYAKTAEQLSDKDGFVTWGTSSPRLKLEYTSLDGRPVTDYNTGLDVHIASDRGSKARNTSYHELLHYTTDNAKGIYTQYATPIHNGVFEPIGLDYGDNILIPRGKTWQHFIAEQNETLLPKMDSIYKKVIDNPSEVENTLIQMGRTPEEAKQQVQILRNEIQDLDDIQEVRAHMKTWFKSDVMPYLKNPNDASEIESVLKDIPDILENRPDKVRRVMEVVRPGSLSDYSKYLAESLSVLPFIYNKSNNK